LFDAFQRVLGECANTDIDPIDVDKISDAAVDNRAFPSVFVRQDR
jgi:hypothetical protein